MRQSLTTEVALNGSTWSNSSWWNYLHVETRNCIVLSGVYCLYTGNCSEDVYWLSVATSLNYIIPSTVPISSVLCASFYVFCESLSVCQSLSLNNNTALNINVIPNVSSVHCCSFIPSTSTGTITYTVRDNSQLSGIFVSVGNNYLLNVHCIDWLKEKRLGHQFSNSCHVWTFLYIHFLSNLLGKLTFLLEQSRVL